MINSSTEFLKNKSHDPVVLPKQEENPNIGSNATNGYIQEALSNSKRYESLNYCIIVYGF